MFDGSEPVAILFIGDITQDCATERALDQNSWTATLHQHGNAIKALTRPHYHIARDLSLPVVTFMYNQCTTNVMKIFFQNFLI